MQASHLSEQFGPIDIYLFDQLLRGRIRPGTRILDAGCGAGRNLVYLLRNATAEHFQIFGVDSDPLAIAAIQAMASSLAPDIPAGNFRVEKLEQMSFKDDFADLLISSAVLHFASSDSHFQGMLNGMWRVLKPGGLFFCRLASTIGIEHQVSRIAGRRYHLPDGSDRYLVDETLLTELTEQLGARLMDPLKTTVVQNQRSMTTWVLRKL
jgi:SAM-dependent methyltransferase